MDASDLRRHALAARQFSVDLGGGVFVTLTDLTRLQMQLALLEAAGPERQFDAASKLRYRRIELLRAVTGWSGVLESHFLGAGSGEYAATAFEPELVEVLLDAKPEWEDKLSAALTERAERRAAALDSAEKN